MASIPPLPSSARELSSFKNFAAKQAVGEWERGGPADRGLWSGGLAGVPGGRGAAGGPTGRLQIWGADLRLLPPDAA